MEKRWKASLEGKPKVIPNVNIKSRSCTSQTVFKLPININSDPSCAVIGSIVAVAEKLITYSGMDGLC